MPVAGAKASRMRASAFLEARRDLLAARRVLPHVAARLSKTKLRQVRAPHFLYLLAS
jgi:hypothetical protein